MHLFKFFNVETAIPNNLELKGLARFINPLIELMNEKPHLPKILFIVPDKDILSILHSIGVSDALTIGTVIHYLVKQIDMIIERRCMDLLDKKPGSVCKDDQPKIVWVRMLKRPAVVCLVSSNIYAL